MAAGPQPQSLVAAMDPETIMMTTCIFLSHTETVYVYMLICREREAACCASCGRHSTANKSTTHCGAQLLWCMTVTGLILAYLNNSNT